MPTNPSPAAIVPAANGQGLPSIAPGETASSAAAAQAEATIKARYAMAFRQPRNLDAVRDRLLADCRRPRFAEVARWKRPVGGKQITGPSIRLAEAAIRAMGNVDVQTPTVFDDDGKRIVRVSVTDLEANATYSVDITVAKTVERRDGDGREVLGIRENAQKQMVYIVKATDDELMVKQAALVSKAIRTCALRLVPGDILEEALELAAATLANADKADPEAGRKRLLDSFATVGVTGAMLGKFLGHDTSAVSPAELADLRAIFAAIRDGEARWADFAEGAATPDSRPRPKKAAQIAAAKRAAIEIEAATDDNALIGLCVAKEAAWDETLADDGKADVTRALDAKAKALGMDGVDDLRQRIVAAKGE